MDAVLWYLIPDISRQLFIRINGDNMKIIFRKKQDESVKRIINIISIIETIPIEALGNSADGFTKLTQLYEETAELAYTIDGVRGLNMGISHFEKRARSFDEMMAISKAHLKVVNNHTEKEN